VTPDGDTLIAFSTTGYVFVVNITSDDVTVTMHNTSSTNSSIPTPTQAATWIPNSFPNIDHNLSFFLGGGHRLTIATLKTGEDDSIGITDLKNLPKLFVLDEIIPYPAINRTLLLLDRETKQPTVWYYVCRFKSDWDECGSGDLSTLNLAGDSKQWDEWWAPHGMALSPSNTRLLVISTGSQEGNGGGTIYEITIANDTGLAATSTKVLYRSSKQMNKDTENILQRQKLDKRSSSRDLRPPVLTLLGLVFLVLGTVLLLKNDPRVRMNRQLYIPL
jgi:hypothetical protein